MTGVDSRIAKHMCPHEARSFLPGQEIDPQEHRHRAMLGPQGKRPPDELQRERVGRIRQDQVKRAAVVVAQEVLAGLDFAGHEAGVGKLMLEDSGDCTAAYGWFRDAARIVPAQMRNHREREPGRCFVKILSLADGGAVSRRHVQLFDCETNQENRHRPAVVPEWCRMVP
jgi:hypothetical protein